MLNCVVELSSDIKLDDKLIFQSDSCFGFFENRFNKRLYVYPTKVVFPIHSP